MSLDLLLGLLGTAAGAIAAVVGFGIGSILTSALAAKVGIISAVGAISIPHLLGTLRVRPVLAERRRRLKIRNRLYTQWAGREELFDRERGGDPDRLWEACAVACESAEM